MTPVGFPWGNVWRDRLPLDPQVLMVRKEHSQRRASLKQAGGNCLGTAHRGTQWAVRRWTNEEKMLTLLLISKKRTWKTWNIPLAWWISPRDDSHPPASPCLPTREHLTMCGNMLVVKVAEGAADMLLTIPQCTR